MARLPIPIEARIAGGVVIVGVSGFILFKAYRHFFPSGTDKADKEESKANADTVKSANDLLSRYIKLKKPTFSDTMFKGWCDVLYKAMDGVGTNFGTIKNVIGYMSSDTDIVKLIVTFGIRNRKTNNQVSSEASPLNLNSWFAEELSDNEIFELNKLLSKKMIGYRF